MRPCINQATTMTTDFETDMRAYAAAGFDAVELWLAKVIDYADTDPHVCGKAGSEQARRLLEELHLEPVCACKLIVLRMLRAG